MVAGGLNVSYAPNATSTPYGPMTIHVRRFLVQFAGLGTSARERIVARYASLSSQRKFVLAEKTLAETIERSGRIAERDALAGPFLQLVRRAPPVAVDAASELSAYDAEQFDAVAEPALAAVLTLLVADLIEPSAAAALYAPLSDDIAWPL